MVRQNPYKESCIERMKELIRQKYNKIAVIKQIKQEFKYVHQSTFYPWFDIKNWEEDNRIEVHDFRQDKIDLKKQIYEDQKKLYNTSTDYEEKEKAMNILLSHFLKRVD